MRDWLKEFEIAVINEDLPLLIKLSDETPDDLHEDLFLRAKALIDRAIVLFEAERAKTLKSLNALKKSKEYVSKSKASPKAFDNKF